MIVLILGIRISKTRAPEIPRRKLTKSPMDVVFKIADIEKDEVNVYFRRPREAEQTESNGNSIFIHFYSPRTEAPDVKNSNSFWIATQERASVLDMIIGLLETIDYELHDAKKINLHFGWPLSSWFDRLSIGIMTYRLIRLPKKFPNFNFVMKHEPLAV